MSGTNILIRPPTDKHSEIVWKGVAFKSYCLTRNFNDFYNASTLWVGHVRGFDPMAPLNSCHCDGHTAVTAG